MLNAKHFTYWYQTSALFRNYRADEVFLYVSCQTSRFPLWSLYDGNKRESREEKKSARESLVSVTLKHSAWDRNVTKQRHVKTRQTKTNTDHVHVPQPIFLTATN